MEFANIDETVLRSPKFIAMAVGSFCAFISYVSMSNASGLYGSPEHCGVRDSIPAAAYDPSTGYPIDGKKAFTEGENNGCAYNEYSEFRYLVGVGVLYWLYTLALMAMYVLKKLPAPVQEFSANALAAVLVFFAFFVGAQKCNDDTFDTKSVCHGSSAARTAVAFTFFEWMAVTASSFLTFRDWRDTAYEGLHPSLSSALSVEGGLPHTQGGGQPYGGPPQAAPVIATSTQTYG
mmetsp:Transcript_7571/g.8726  ORF Transcript_7571/g.8726 Transcript_7571/m.8726 type:complete len:234 (+) Transcript_7571:125-826(+)